MKAAKEYYKKLIGVLNKVRIIQRFWKRVMIRLEAKKMIKERNKEKINKFN
jgi:hypothetical protein